LKIKKILKIVEKLEIKLVFCLATPGGTIHHLPPFELGSKDEFQQNDTHALIIITNCLNNIQVFHINSCNTSKETWDEVFNLLEVHCRNPILRECEDEIHTPEIGTWESSGTLEISEFDCRGQNTSHWGVLYIIGKLSKCKCRKRARMGHLDIYNTSYGKKKG